MTTLHRLLSGPVATRRHLHRPRSEVAMTRRPHHARVVTRHHRRRHPSVGATILHPLPVGRAEIRRLHHRRPSAVETTHRRRRVAYLSSTRLPSA